LAGILLIWATSGFAQKSLLTGSDLAPLEACFEKQLKEAATNNEPVVDQAGLECVGLAVVPCKIKLFATGSIPKSECPNAEHEWWDVKLNQAYKVMMKEAKRADALGKNLSFSEVDSLLKMQRAWIGYRDATCHFSYLQFGGGHFRSNRGSRMSVVAHGAADNISDQLYVALGGKKLRQL